DRADERREYREQDDAVEKVPAEEAHPLDRGRSLGLHLRIMRVAGRVGKRAPRRLLWQVTPFARSGGTVADDAFRHRSVVTAGWVGARRGRSVVEEAPGSPGVGGGRRDANTNLEDRRGRTAGGRDGGA